MQKRIARCLLSGFALAPLLALTACGDRMPTVREMCTQQPGLCSDLNDDNWCRAERRQLIITRYKHEQQASPELKYYLLKDLQAYSQCIELASNIEHKQLKSKQSHRIEAFLNSQAAIKKRAAETANSDHPLLLYWHWANRSDNQALDKLLALEHKPQMQTHELQMALATYYAKEDQSKVISHLYNALRLYRPTDRFNVEIPESIVTYYLNQQNVKQAYIWSEVALAFGSELMNRRQMKTIVNASPDQYDEWESIAEDIIDEIEDGKFRRRPDGS